MKTRIENLREQIHQHNIDYYAGRSVVNNSAYDAMFKKLIELEKDYPEFYDPNSPTQRVGSEALNQFKRIKRKYAALSIPTAPISLDMQQKVGR